MPELAERVRAFIEDELRPMVQVDGGDVVFGGLLPARSGDGARVRVRFRADCSRCPAARARLAPWIARRLRDEFGGAFEVEPVVDRPYFYR